MSGNESRQLVAREPVEPDHPAVGRSPSPALLIVLPGADHRDLDGVVTRQFCQRPPDRGRPLQGGEQSEEHHSHRAVGPFRIRCPPGSEPVVLGAHRHDHHIRARSMDDAGGVLFGVHHHDIGGSYRAPVDCGEHSVLQTARAGQPAIACRARKRNQMIEHDGCPAEERTSEQDIEVPEVAHQDRVRPGASRTVRKPHPIASQPAGRPGDPPGLPHYPDTGSGIEVERIIHLYDVVTRGAEALDQHADPGMPADIICPEDYPAHR